MAWEFSAASLRVSRYTPVSLEVACCVPLMLASKSLVGIPDVGRVCQARAICPMDSDRLITEL